MDAASILLALAMAGQSGWAPERTAAPPPASVPNYDRYAHPPASTAPGVAPPPGVMDRARTAFTETGTTLREGVEAGIEAANEQLYRGGGQLLDTTRSTGQELGQQLQGWTDNAGRQLQATGNNLRTATEQAIGATPNSSQRTSNPFGATSAPPPTASSRTRGNVAPPPWPETSATTAPSWSAEPAAGAGVANRAASQGMAPARTENGWTSIGSNVAAPPLLVPQLASTATNTSATRTTVGNSGPNFPAASSGREPLHSVLADQPRQDTPAANPANDWATGWDNTSATPQATIGRSGNTALPNDTVRDSDLVPIQPANTGPQNSRQQTAGGWGDIWGDTDPWAQQAQSAPAGVAAQQAPVAAATPVESSSNQFPGATTNILNTSAPAPVVAQATGIPPAIQNPSVAAPPTEQPPWIPLLVVSLSLAGSLGANLFLGWSYMDARQKYRSLVRKTADKFRRAAAAAA